MIIYPAIDLREGQCVRLKQGDMARATVYGTDPVAIARHWEAQGAQWLHVVDLDGAFAKTPKNRDVIGAIVKAVSIPVQLGGGLRSMETLEYYIDLGVRRLILGTWALRDPQVVETACQRFPGRIALGIDARHGYVAVEGWRETTRVEAVAFAQRFDQVGLSAIIYTDIQRDGMQSGVNVEATRRLCAASTTPVIASGGVASWDDIQALLPLVPLGLDGVITGKALYTGTLNLQEALHRLQSLGTFT
ncbi:MAG: 1-(5-phosphoribosyl)-5-[(5-phosphoribosylamino)methylideneamino]imidazole-4-carboxamide isomerase [Desulfosoma sp.]|uniref:1-(5-phosphoribosyl)-5-[(5- phosphoribosylamino)methylideneamino]imidazole-4- carboxamide isomerase n=1 Tax=Desulfosoma sp. TaxID=2603217 RepID=UPI004049A18B